MNLPLLILVLGILIILISLIADTLGIGTGGGLGWKQMAGIAVGVILAVVGAVMRSRAGKKSSSA